MNKNGSKTKVLLPTAIILGVFLVAGISIVSAANGHVSSPQEIADSLTAKLHQAVADAESKGAYTTDSQGRKVFTPETTAQIQQLHDAAAKAHMATMERPVAERQGAISKIQEFVADQSVKGFVGDQTANVGYTATGKSSYNSKAITEFYRVGQDYVEVNMNNNEIVQFGPAPVKPGEETKKFDTTAKFSVGDLQTKANEFVAKNARIADLSTLKASTGDKMGTNYFFRWEDPNKMLEDGRPAFVQVGFTIGGELLSYTNSLSI